MRFVFLLFSLLSFSPLLFSLLASQRMYLYISSRRRRSHISQLSCVAMRVQYTSRTTRLSPLTRNTTSKHKHNNTWYKQQLLPTNNHNGHIFFSTTTIFLQTHIILYLYIDAKYLFVFFFLLYPIVICLFSGHFNTTIILFTVFSLPHRNYKN